MNEGDGESALKYKKSYFDEFPKTWHHGDYVVINKETGGVIVLGRSDATLNPGTIGDVFAPFCLLLSNAVV